MSLAKVNHVAKARKDQGKCESCDTVIVRGMPYYHFTVGFRSSRKRVRCVHHYPRLSDRESSMKATVYAAQENFEDAVTNIVLDDHTIESMEDVLSTIRDAYEEFVEDVRTYAEDRRTALDMWEYGNSQLEELADDAENALAEVEDWEPDDFYGDEDDTESIREHLEEVVSDALDRVQGVAI